MRGIRRVDSAAFAGLLLIAACGSESGTIKESRSAASVLTIEPQAVIGKLEGDPAFLFGDIRAVAVDESGRAYVGDRIGATVRVYSAEGDFIAQVAREGQGPGEIEGWPADLSFGPDGDLYVRDASRITRFTSRQQQSIPDSVVEIWRYPGYGNLTYARSRVGKDGTYYYPNGTYRIGEPARFFYETFRDGVLGPDTLAVPYYEGMEARRSAFYRTGPSGGRMVDGLNRVPFAPVPTWDATHRGTVLSTDGSGNQLLESDETRDTVRVIELPPASRRSIPPGERADSLRALEVRIDSLPVRIEEVVNLGRGVAERELPELLPPVVSVHVGEDDLVWIERWPEEGAADSRFYDVIDTSGAFLASVRLQAPLVSEPQPYFSRRAVVGVVVDPRTGVQTVVTFFLPGLSGQE